MQIIKTKSQYHYTSILLTDDDIMGLKLRHGTIDAGMTHTLRRQFATCPVVQTCDNLADDYDLRIPLIQELGKTIGIKSKVEKYVVDFDHYDTISKELTFIERFCLLVIKWDDPFEAAMHQLNPFILYGVD